MRRRLSIFGGVCVLAAMLPSPAGAFAVTQEYPASAPVFFGPPNQQIVPAVATAGAVSLVVWEDGRIFGESEIYGARVRDGLVLDPGGITIATTFGIRHRRPAVASNGSSFLVVWEEERTDGTDVGGVLVGAEGNMTPLKTDLTPVPSSRANPAVASVGTDYLVVWEERTAGAVSDIFGARVMGNGVVLDPAGLPLAALPGQQTSPAVASSGSGYLVVWEEPILGPAGALAIKGTRVIGPLALDPHGLVIAEAQGDAALPAVASNGTSYLVVYQSGAADDHDIFGVLLHGAALPLLPFGPSPLEISRSGGDQFASTVAANGGAYFAAWTDQGATQDIRGARISGVGGLGDAVAVSTAGGPQSAPAVAPSGTGFLTAWADARFDGSGDVYGARVPAEGGVLEPAGILVSGLADEQTAPVLAGDGSSFLAVWQGFSPRTGGTDIHGASVDASGAAVGTQFAIADGVGDQTTPAVAWGSTSFLVVWTDQRTGGESSDVYGALVRAGVAQPEIVISQSAGAQLNPAVAWNGTEFVVAWESQVPGFTADVYGARVSEAGVVSAPIAISTEVETQRFPAMARAGSDVFVVWEDLRSGSNYDIYGARVSATGAVSASFPVSTANGDQFRPAPAWDGAGSHLVVWEDRRSDGGDIFGALVTASGPQPEEAISRGPLRQGVPKAAWRGNGFLVAWEDYRSGAASDVYAARVKPTGALVDTTAIPVATSGRAEVTPAMAPGLTGRTAVLYARSGPGSDFGGSARAIFRFFDDPPNDAYDAPQVLVGATGTVTGVNGGASKEPGEPNHAGNPGGASVWYGWRAPSRGLVTFDTEGSTFDTLLAIWVGRPNTFQGIVSIAADDDSGPNQTSRVTFAVEGGWDYLIAVDGKGGQTGAVVLRWSFTEDLAPPVVTIEDAQIAAKTATFLYRANEASSYECSLDSASLTSCGADAGNIVGRPQSITYQRLPNGPHIFRVRGTDRAGNVGDPPTAYSWIVNAPPEAYVTAGPGPFEASTSATFELTSTDPGASFECRLDGGAFSGCISPVTYNGLQRTPHTFEVRDRGGPVDSRTWTVDDSGPPVQILRPPPGVYLNDQPVLQGGVATVLIGPTTVKASAFDLGSGIDTFCFEVNGVPRDPCFENEDQGVYTFTFAPPEVGRYTITARARNRADIPATAVVDVLAVPAS